MPRWLRTPVEAGIARLPRNDTLKRGVASLAIDQRMQRYRQVFSIMPGDRVDGLFRPGVLGSDAVDCVHRSFEDLEPFMAGADELGAFQLVELRSSLPDELLMYADKLSMASGLEVRVPYLDREVVELVSRLPARFKVRHGQRKWLHRRVCERFLPRSITRRKKRGFAVDVVDGWFRAEHSGWLRDRLLDPGSLMYQYLRPESVRGLLEEHRAGRADRHKMLFSLIVLEEWLRSHARAQLDAAA
jgi:asparagine synthase (glutamine-hydrolysing)